MSNIIELTKVIDEVESNPASLSWLENVELQEKDLTGSIRFVRGIFAGVVFSLLMLAIALLCSGCTFAVTIDTPSWSGPVDDVGEPMGWQSDADRLELDRELNK